MTGAVAAYRGYRLQALYALLRVLELGPQEEAQPEGVEDLAIMVGGRLTEALQIKSLAVPLTLSHLHPGLNDSFFRAAVERTHAGGNERLRIVSFGPLGQELAQLRVRDHTARDSVLRKLTTAGLDRSAVESVLDRLEIILVSEADLVMRISERLRLLVTGIDPDSAFDLLSLWMYRSSEGRARVTTEDAKARVVAVASFLADMQARHSEWFISVVPLEEPELTDVRVDELASEFYQGVSVRFEHVVAALPVRRPALLAEIDSGLERERVVVVHAASGQGKTTLAYQYMAELPALWRFTVRLVEDRAHALRVARALIGHARAMGLPLYVHVDVGPRDRDWPTLVREIASSPQVRVIVTIREEDWRRASDISSFRFVDIDPTLDVSEAEEIYEALRGRFPDSPATFDEAWNRFGSGGPLLEFVYLVTQREELRARLSDQVNSLRENALTSGNLGKIEFLRRVSVVAAAGATLRLRNLAEDVGLLDAARTVASMEREYLLRVSSDGGRVGGLHPVRSELLQQLLTDDALNPWLDEVVKALPFVVEEDLEACLLYSFARASRVYQPLLDAVLKLQPTSWGGYAGIGRALRWLGLADYAEANRSLIEEVDPDRSGRWSVTLDVDLSDAMPGLIGQIWETLERVDRRGPEAARKGREYRDRQRPKDEAFALMRRWLEESSLPDQPHSAADWAAFGEMMFFRGRLGVSWSVPWLRVDQMDSTVESGSLEDLAALSLGLSLDQDVSREWLNRHRSTLISRYRQTANVVAVGDDGSALHIDFLLTPAKVRPSGEDVPGPRDPNDESVWRLDMLRRLIPDREIYSSQGWGHRVPGIDLDGTVKRIDKKNLPPLWLTAINSGFRGYVERWWRPQSWSEYRDAETEIREATHRCLIKITGALTTYHRRSHGQILGELLAESWFQDWQSQIDRSALLPLSAVDPYGFVDESTVQVDAMGLGEAFGLAMLSYAAYVRARRGHLRPLHNFASQAPAALAVAGPLGRAPVGNRENILALAAEAGISPDVQRLSALNLRDAMEGLPAYQAEIRRLFPTYNYSALEFRERLAFRRAVAAWDFFVRTPWSRSADSAHEEGRRLARGVATFERRLLEELRSINSTVAWAITFVEELGAEAILISGDGTNAAEVYASLDAALQRAHEVLTEVPEHVLAWLKARWPALWITAFVRGRPLSAEGIGQSTLVLAGNEWSPQWWHSVPRQLPEALGRTLTPWSLPEMFHADRLATAVVALLGLTLHVVDLPDDATFDDQGRDILRSHIADLESDWEAHWRSSLADIGAMSQLLESGALGPGEHDRIVEGLTTLTGLLRMADPASDVRKESHVTSDSWTSAIGQAVQIVGSLRLAWATIVVNQAVGNGSRSR